MSPVTSLQSATASYYEDGGDVTSDFFAIRDGELLLSRGAMPSMLTLDERIIRQDCLCYLMERYALP
jgi:hypothetical protein